ncbi:MAG: CHAT domain-containing protein, partial [Bacteroidia bacterium]|nr:CHAT domain-containing protein [Bacteroidia bacterium]
VKVYCKNTLSWVLNHYIGLNDIDMKNTFLYKIIIGLICVMGWGGLIGQEQKSVYHYFEDSLTYYQSQDSFFQYLNLLDKVNSRIRVENKRATQRKKQELNIAQNDSIISITKNRILKLSKYYDLFRQPTSKEERLRAREVFTGHAFSYYKNLGDIDKAQKYFLQAYENVENKYSLDKFCWYIENEIANNFTRKGDYERALYFYEKVLRNFEERKVRKNRLRLLTNMGRCYRYAEREKEALDVFIKSLEFADQDKQLETLVHLSLSELYASLDSLNKAEHHFQIINKLGKEFYKDKGVRIKVLEGDILSKKELFSEADQKYESALVDLRNDTNYVLNRIEAKIVEKRIIAFIKDGRFDKAEDLIYEAFSILIEGYKMETKQLPEIDMLHLENTFFTLYEMYSRIKYRRFEENQEFEDLEASNKAILTSLKLVEKFRKSYVSDKSKSIKVKVKKDFVDHALNVSNRLYELDDMKDMSDITYLFEQSKSILLLEKMIYNSKKGKNKIAGNGDSLKLRIKELNKQIAKVQDSKIVDSLRLIEMSIQEEINKKEIEFSKISSLENTAIIDFIYSDNYIYSLVEENDSITFFNHGSSQTLDTLVNALNKNLSGERNNEDLDFILKDLYLFLIKPLSIKSDKIIIIPDGKLSLVPFDILKDELGDYLLESKILSYNYHRSIVTNERAQNKSLELFCLAPSYNSKPNSDEKFISRAAPYQLNYVDDEIKAIQNLFNTSKIKEGFENIEFSGDLNNVSIFHFAGHAKVLKDSAFIYLNDTLKLNFTDILLEQFDVDLVTLSACETGLGEFKYGEGVQSLGRAFMSSGASTIVNSLWAVNDHSTSLMMKYFYSNLNKGYDVDDALRRAKIKYIADASPELQHPYYWGGFVVYGNFSPLVGKSQPLIYWTLLFIIFLGLIIYKKGIFKK